MTITRALRAPIDGVRRQTGPSATTAENSSALEVAIIFFSLVKTIF
jgi:hypothetical protein